MVLRARWEIRHQGWSRGSAGPPRLVCMVSQPPGAGPAFFMAVQSSKGAGKEKYTSGIC